MHGWFPETKSELLENFGGRNFHIGTSFFLNITTIIDNIIIKKGINYLLKFSVIGKVPPMYYLHSRSVNDRRHSLKLTTKFRYGTFSFWSITLYK